MYVHVSRQEQPRCVLVEPVGAGTLLARRSQTVASTPATPIMCHGSLLLSYTGATTVVIGPQMLGIEAYGSDHEYPSTLFRLLKRA